MRNKSRQLGWVVVALCHWGLGGCGDSGNEPAAAGNGAGMGAGVEAGTSQATATGGTGSPPSDGPNPDTGSTTTLGMGPPCQPPSGRELSELAAEVFYAGDDPFDVRVIDNQLFVSDRNTIRRMALTGGQSEQVIQPAPENIGIIHANSTHLFFDVDDAFVRVPIDATGATPEGIYRGTSNDLIQAVDDSYIYFLTRDTDSINRVSVDGGGVIETLLSGVDRLFNVIDGFAYFSRDLGYDYRVSRIPLSGGSEEDLADLSWPYWAVADGSRVYIGGRGGINEVAPDAKPVRIMRSPSAYPANGDIDEMVLSGGRIYWSSDAVSVGWTETSGATCDTIVDLGIYIGRWTIGPDSLYFTKYQTS